jgi:tetratricopeptide (TPR) repeat protein
VIEQALVSGALGKALYRDTDSRYFICGIDDNSWTREARTGEIEFLLALGAEFRELPKQDLTADRIASELSVDERRYNALFLVLSGVDPTLPDEVKREARAGAEILLKDGETGAFVRNRMLSRPSPQDIFGQRPEQDTRAPLTSHILSTVFQSQSVIREVFGCWQAVAAEYFESDEKREAAERSVIDSGFLAEVVQTVVAGEVNRVNDLVVGFAVRLKLTIPKIAFVLNDFRMRVFATFPPTAIWSEPRAEQEVEPEKDEYLQLIYEFNPFDPSRRRSKLTARESVTSVQKQIAGIRELLFSGNTSLAEKSFRELLAFNLEHGERHHVAMTLCNLSNIALDANELEMAEHLVDTAFSLGIENDRVIYTSRAEVFRRTGRFNAALSAYEEAKRLFPNDHYAFCAYAETFRDMGKYTEALKGYDEAIRLFPDDPVPWTGRGNTLLSMGRAVEAEKELRAANTRFTSAALPASLVKALNFLGKYDEALKLGVVLARHFQQNAFSQIGYARTLVTSGRLTEALEAYRVIARRFPDSPFGFTGQAEVAKRLGNLDEALKIYTKALDEFPKNPLVTNGYASILILLGRTTEALGLLRGDRLVSELDWHGHRLVSLAYLRSGGLDTAVSRLNFGYHSCPWFELRSRYATSLGVAMIRKGKSSQALGVLKRDMNLISKVRRQRRTVLLSHVYADLGRISTARSTIDGMTTVVDKTVSDLKDRFLACFYSGSFSLSKSIQSKIYDDEFAIAMNA